MNEEEKYEVEQKYQNIVTNIDRIKANLEAMIYFAKEAVEIAEKLKEVANIGGEVIEDKTT